MRLLNGSIGTGLFVIVGSAVAVGLAHQGVKGERAFIKLPFKNEVSISVKDGYRRIVSNGIPNHVVGQFPGRGNPNKIAPQKYSFRVPVEPKPADGQGRVQIFGVAINGIVFDPGTAELWNNDFRWHYEALAGQLGSNNSLGVDENLAHVQPNGAYHYHGLPRALLAKLDSKHSMALVGWAADGYPIYGPYGYRDPQDRKSGLQELKSSYRLREGKRPGGDGPGGSYDGSFASDYTYVKGAGDLDEHNGRFGVTPEFPKGTFYYVLTEDWPFVPRIFKGLPDASFSKGGPGGPGGRQGGPGGPGGPGGQGQGIRMGPPRGMLPGEPLASYLELTKAQKAKYAEFKKVIEALEEESFAMGAFAELNLTKSQIHKVGTGSSLRSVLTTSQKEFLESHHRPGGPPMEGPPPNGQ